MGGKDESNTDNVAKINYIFDAFDALTDKNGRLTYDNMITQFKNVGVTIPQDAQPKELFDSIDNDNSGYIDKNEFQTFLGGTYKIDIQISFIQISCKHHANIMQINSVWSWS